MSFEQLALLQLLPTLFMAGVIWFVQFVHYPLFGDVDQQAFVRYEAHHTTRTTWVVLPPMVAELALAFILALRAPAGQHFLAWTGAALAVAIWLSTFLLQVPCHRRLSQGFEAAIHQRLVRGNWLRTALWTGRVAVALAMVWPG